MFRFKMKPVLVISTFKGCISCQSKLSKYLYKLYMNQTVNEIWIYWDIRIYSRCGNLYYFYLCVCNFQFDDKIDIHQVFNVLCFFCHNNSNILRAVEVKLDYHSTFYIDIIFRKAIVLPWFSSFAVGRQLSNL